LLPHTEHLFKDIFYLGQTSMQLIIVILRQIFICEENLYDLRTNRKSFLWFFYQVEKFNFLFLFIFIKNHTPKI